MPNKTFWKGEWRRVEQTDPLEPRGRLGAPCPAFVEGEDVKWIAEGSYGASGNFVPASQSGPPLPPLPSIGDWTYRVVTAADPWFGGKFGPERLEERLNDLGRNGWRAIGMAGGRQDPAVLVERRVDEEFLAEARRRREGALPPG